MKFWWVIPPMLALTGCRTSFYDISYDHMRLGILSTDVVHDGDCYFRIERTKGLDIRWLPEWPSISEWVYPY